MVELRGVRKVFRARGREIVALDGVDLVARRGEVLGVVGRSGAGKSTLIRCVNRLEQPTAGTIVVDGRDITRVRGAELRAARRRMGMIFQHFNLLSSRTALDNVALPLEIAGVEQRERARRAAELLELVGLADRARSYPSQLSGGQKQRVGIARALAAEPAVLLSDEATSALDAETTSSVLGLLRDLNERLGLTVLLITHEMEVVKRVCDSVALLRDGRVVESGPIGDVVARPDSSLAESLLSAPADRAPGSPAVDVVLLDRDAERSVAAALSGALGNGNARTELEAAVTAAGGPVRVAGGSVEMIGGRRVGRLTLAPEGGAEAASRLAAELRARGAKATELGRESAESRDNGAGGNRRESAEPRGNGAGATELGPRADGAP